MCGFFSLHATDPEDFRKKFNVENMDESEYEKAQSLKYYPRSTVITVSKNSPNAMKLRYWQLIPRWYKDDPYKMKWSAFNARSEDIETKATFKIPWNKSQRCLFPMNWFYEFETVEVEGEKRPKKIPYKVSVEDTEVFGVAGLYEIWKDAEDHPIESCTMITCESVDTLKKIHSRQPVILKKDDWETWLNPETKPEDAKKMIQPWNHLVVERIDQRFNKSNASQIQEHPNIIETIVGE